MYPQHIPLPDKKCDFIFGRVNRFPVCQAIFLDFICMNLCGRAEEQCGWTGGVIFSENVAEKLNELGKLMFSFPEFY